MRNSVLSTQSREGKVPYHQIVFSPLSRIKVYREKPTCPHNFVKSEVRDKNYTSEYLIFSAEEKAKAVNLESTAKHKPI